MKWFRDNLPKPKYKQIGVDLMAKVLWENSRRGLLTSIEGIKIKIHIRKPFTSALTYGVYLNDNKIPTLSETTIEGARQQIESFFGGVR